MLQQVLQLEHQHQVLQLQPEHLQLLQLPQHQVFLYPPIVGLVLRAGRTGGYGVTLLHQLVIDANVFKDLLVLLQQHQQIHQQQHHQTLYKSSST
jgi:hypothetical protein